MCATAISPISMPPNLPATIVDIALSSENTAIAFRREAHQTSSFTIFIPLQSPGSWIQTPKHRTNWKTTKHHIGIYAYVQTRSPRPICIPPEAHSNSTFLRPFWTGSSSIFEERKEEVWQLKFITESWKTRSKNGRTHRRKRESNRLKKSLTRSRAALKLRSEE